MHASRVAQERQREGRCGMSTLTDEDLYELYGIER